MDKDTSQPLLDTVNENVRKETEKVIVDQKVKKEVRKEAIGAVLNQGIKTKSTK